MAALGVTGLSIVRASPSTHVDAFCDDWLEYDRAMRALGASWDWDPFRWHFIIPDLTFTTVAAVDPLNDQMEGLIAVDPDKVKHALVVEWLQTSPRNHGANGLRRGVGTMLLRWAVRQSESLGRNGALALVSKPSADRFYDKLGFTVVGKTPKNQKIYELQASRVANFLQVATLNGVGFP